ncbi:MAG: restriction endonuclease [SAR324 cluster bacterium]|uniref:Restriction endonuclease n=1 Tax=SAR324 cluster bacterium TaxID=2024889 RepID=A0A2A4T0I2_9DELT|nr:MAG: restriction endonuclease [SAR324 cluster bacterium]
MDLIDKLREIANRVKAQSDNIETEEATKNAFIMPFINALGYDVFDPTEVVPEYTADVGIKKGEKVDYAIKKEGSVIILMECKWHGHQLSNDHASQLHRYFAVSETRFGILTNGIHYQFFSDIDEPNKMDSKPFFEFNLLDFDDHQVNELKKFTKATFSLDDILTTASSLKYAGAIKKILASELEKPSEGFIRFFVSQIYDGRITAQVVEKFSGIVKKAQNQFIIERINSRLKTALSEEPDTDNSSIESVVAEELDPETENKNNNGIHTTEDELEAYNIVRAILRESIDPSRITLRDTKSYCGILLDDNNRKPVCRLHFNSSQKQIGVFDDKKETKIPIENIDDIFNHAECIKSSLTAYGVDLS